MAISYPLDPNEKLSDKYALKDLTVTNQPYPNLPVEGQDQEFKNLKWLARTLEELESDIGPFNILSAFRSPDVQRALAAAGEPVALKKSFHEAGMAVDIFPTTMSISEYFGKILASDWKDRLGEIALKPDQNTLHLSLPTDTQQGIVMVLDSAGKYIRQTADEVYEWAKPFLSNALDSLEAATVETTSEGKKRVRLWVWVASAVFGMGIFMLFVKPKRSV